MHVKSGICKGGLSKSDRKCFDQISLNLEGLSAVMLVSNGWPWTSGRMVGDLQEYVRLVGQGSMIESHFGCTSNSFFSNGDHIVLAHQCMWLGNMYTDSIIVLLETFKTLKQHDGDTYCAAPSLRRLSLLSSNRTSVEKIQQDDLTRRQNNRKTD